MVNAFGRSGRTTSVTIGSKNRRQVIIYDKRLEVRNTPEKAPWLDIWKASMANRGIDPVDFKNRYDGAVWRVEARAGKRCLKDQHNVTSWSDLHREIKPIFETVLDKIRYTNPKADSNRSRWPEHRFWDLAREEVNRIELDRAGLVDQDRILSACRAAQLGIIDQQLVGLAATRVALAAGSPNDPNPYQTAIKPLQTAIESDSAKFAKRIEKAKERYAHLL